MKSIPESWITTDLGSICETVKQIDPKTLFGSTFKYVDISSINSKFLRVTEAKEVHISEAPSRARQLIRNGDVVFSTVRTNLKRIALIGEGLDNQIASTGFAVLRPKPDVDSRYIFYYVSSQEFVDKVSLLQRGASYPAVRPSDVFSQKIPLAPLPEQKRIVAKLDKLFAHLDQIKARLERIPELLKQFRQAVLTQAVTGKLTEEWRRENANLRSASELIRQLLVDREKKYLHDLAEAESKSLRKPSKPRLVDRKVNSERLPEIPSSWRWVYGETMFEKIFDGTHSSPKNFPTGKYKYITAKNIKEWGIDLSSVTYVSEEDHKEIYSRADVRRNDVLYIKDGATTGIATLNSLDEEFSLLSSVGVFRCNQDYVSPNFVKYYLNGNRQRFLAMIAGIAITRLTLDKLNKAIFCLAPIEEQNEIVCRVESLFVKAERIESRYEILKKQINQLPQVILSQAFRGGLVSAEEEVARYSEEVGGVGIAAES